MSDSNERDANDSESDPTIKLNSDSESASRADQSMPSRAKIDPGADETPWEDSEASVDDATLPPRDLAPAQDHHTALPPRTVNSDTIPANDATLPPRSQKGDTVATDEALLPPRAGSGELNTVAEDSVSGSPGSGGDASSRVRHFGEYELIDEIARGAMGVVYQARQAKLNRIVALKMILAGQLASDEDVQRFYIEAEAAANLEHPGIVPIYEIGEHDGQHFFSMAFIEGESLADRVKEGPMPPREAAEITKKIAQAIAYAHEHKVIHRDLKPANILIDADGQPKVTDFGLAKNTEGDSGLTASGQILGTPAYMPPNRPRVRPIPSDHRPISIRWEPFCTLC